MTTLAVRVREILGELERQSSPRIGLEQRTRYGITAAKAYGVPMGAIQKLGKTLGHDHDLAQALWKTGWYEARLLAAYVDDPEEVTPGQMDSWALDWDNWGICDTLCFVLFDRTPYAWAKVKQWSRRKEEFVRRGSFALLASIALHDKGAPDQPFLDAIPLIERASEDDRNFVWKGVAWAIRSAGVRSQLLNREYRALAERLVASENRTAQRIGRGALRDLRRPVRKRVPAGKPTRRSRRRES